MQLALYYAPISCSLVPYIALTEAGADFEVRVVDFRRGGHLSEEYLRINPKHKVPVLVIDGEPLTENVAIQLWIARHYTQAKLLPGGQDEFRAISLLAWCAPGIHPFLTPNVLPQRYCDLPNSADSVQRCAQKVYLENIQIAENLLTNRQWFFDDFTLPDIYFFWCFRRGIQFKIDMSPFQQCQAHFDRVAQRASVSKLLAFESEVLSKLE